MRGNPKLQKDNLIDYRSIPAHAGEPTCSQGTGGNRRVYPRACGGTPLQGRCLAGSAGLSPRMRGNHGRLPRVRPSVGSIPAHAGEPNNRGARWRQARVYPRACGGTRAPRARPSSRPGLSPRMRGNLTRRLASRCSRGSIPAHAGEPLRRAILWPPFGVYPRACGGTAVRAARGHRQGGLSPRMRGNRRPPRGQRVLPRSIPAHAGEPPWLLDGAVG